MQRMPMPPHHHSRLRKCDTRVTSRRGSACSVNDRAQGLHQYFGRYHLFRPQIMWIAASWGLCLGGACTFQTRGEGGSPWAQVRGWHAPSCVRPSAMSAGELLRRAAGLCDGARRARCRRARCRRAAATAASLRTSAAFSTSFYGGKQGSNTFNGGQQGDESV